MLFWEPFIARSLLLTLGGILGIAVTEEAAQESGDCWGAQSRLRIRGQLLIPGGVRMHCSLRIHVGSSSARMECSWRIRVSSSRVMMECSGWIHVGSVVTRRMCAEGRDERSNRHHNRWTPRPNSHWAICAGATHGSSVDEQSLLISVVNELPSVQCFFYQ